VIIRIVAVIICIVAITIRIFFMLRSTFFKISTANPHFDYTD
jgi:hypothetical protein